MSPDVLNKARTDVYFSTPCKYNFALQREYVTYIELYPDKLCYSILTWWDSSSFNFILQL